MPSLLKVLFGATGALVLLTSPAAAQQLGATYRTVQARYVDAKPISLSEHARELELSEIDYAGVRWSKVDFIFGPSARLERMVLRTHTASFEQVLGLAQRQPERRGGKVAVLDEVAPTMQMRVCEGVDGEISLTYEPLASPS